MAEINFAEYIWIDGTKPVPLVRSKAKVFMCDDVENVKLEDFAEWSFDGSSTNQAEGDDSDCILRPVNFVMDPIRGYGNFLVLCEVFNPDGTVHPSNTRSVLRKYLDQGGAKEDPWLGFEQEYTMYSKDKPLGWPENGFPAPQGPYYCGVGDEQVSGRELVEVHARLCLDAGLMLYGINAEVMLGQWEFQIGYRGDDSEKADALTICDHTWLARWLIYRVAEDFEIEIKLDNKPVKGSWNGAGMHTNFSTNSTRDKKNGLKNIIEAAKNLEKHHEEHIAVYGHLLSERLTGEYETSKITDFSYGTADRGCSIRIPRPVEINGYGYFEDRRPGANSDPYEVAAMLVKNVCLNSQKKTKEVA